MISGGLQSLGSSIAFWATTEVVVGAIGSIYVATATLLVLQRPNILKVISPFEDRLFQQALIISI